MQRRHLLKSMAALSVTSTLPVTSIAKSLTKQASATSAINVKQQFNQALANEPSLIGFANIDTNFERQTLAIEGQIPKDLTGCFYRNGPGKHERGEIRYKHLFEGDGMIQRFDINNGQIQHQGKFIQTPKFTRDQAAGKFLYSGPDTKITNALPVSSSDMVNTANTNIIPVGDDLWALWEAGSASQLDGETLAFKQHVDLGNGSKYGKSLKGLPFSAHPKIDPNGDIWNFGLNGSGHIVLYHLTPKGQINNVGIVNAEYRGGMLHDFLITEKHILLILPSLVANHNIKGYFARTQFDKNQAMQVLVVDKNTLTLQKRYELPPGFAFHFGNAWIEQDGTIGFDASLYDDIQVLHDLSGVMHGKMRNANARSKTTFFMLKPNGTTEQYSIDSYSEFPRICNHLTGLKNRYLYHLSAKTDSLWSDSVACIDTQTGKEAVYEFGRDFLVEEHIPVCPKGIEGTGYVIGTALHVPSKRTCLNIFDASNVASGPIARAWLPYHLPLGFHGNFNPA
ncbi:lignostilbene alpha-beta-dioxygenase [Thalassotalea sp. M1531]|uniref:Lignostilbene alpha-beta-dioxygenase n=1 Tax=Thalassotalea algicola TaxID=2716224 RepID=A0A7Y0L9E7_9GAMM|nr:carotenoid oxygenase family protein [Thalassotalea algicola]NMP30023.1 lignostilbene alpha-beta-dioxygenase [Thalassotalea algicola]